MPFHHLPVSGYWPLGDGMLSMRAVSVLGSSPQGITVRFEQVVISWVSGTDPIGAKVDC